MVVIGLEKTANGAEIKFSEQRLCFSWHGTFG